MLEVTTIGLDIAKNVFHVHGADARVRGFFSQRLSRAKVLDFVATQAPCNVAMEACGGADHWGPRIDGTGP